jgi:glycosyltransferase involved in cell wall biosynthesis
MRVIHVPFCFYPDPMGGTEVYVEALGRHLSQQGISSLIAAPALSNQYYEYNHLPVHRFAITPEIRYLADLYGPGDHQGALEFAKLLDAEQPDLVHLHAFTRGVSLRLVKAAKARSLPVVFTYHTPTVSCTRGTLLRWGEEVCDGVIDVAACTACTLQSQGVPRGVAEALAQLPPMLTKPLAHTTLKGKLWTALQMRAMVQCRTEVFQEFMAEVDHVIAVCEWVKRVLILNQVPEAKISLIRQGLCHEPSELSPALEAVKQTDGPLRLIFLGRLDRTKGLDVLVRAIKADPDLKVSLDIYGVLQADSQDDYQHYLQGLIHGEPRVALKAPLRSDQVITTLQTYDLLAIPSQWLETGPMVVLEAFAAGIPVVGSRLGGIAELVTDGVDGLLVEPDSVPGWTGLLKSLCRDRQVLAKLKSSVGQPESMQRVSTLMASIYSDMLCRK